VEFGVMITYLFNYKASTLRLWLVQTGNILVYRLLKLRATILFSFYGIQYYFFKIRTYYCLQGYGLLVCKIWNSLNLLSWRRNQKNIHGYSLSDAVVLGWLEPGPASCGSEFNLASKRQWWQLLKSSWNLLFLAMPLEEPVIKPAGDLLL